MTGDEKGEKQEEATAGPCDKGGSTVSWLARIMSLLGLALFLGAVGLLGYEGLSGAGGDPVITARVEDVVPLGGQWHARITAINSGPTTGAQVAVEGKLMRDGQVIERARLIFDYVPARSQEKGGLFFTRDPSLYELQVRVLGYAQP